MKNTNVKNVIDYLVNSRPLYYKPKHFISFFIVHRVIKNDIIQNLDKNIVVYRVIFEVRRHTGEMLSCRWPLLSFLIQTPQRVRREDYVGTLARGHSTLLREQDAERERLHMVNFN